MTCDFSETDEMLKALTAYYWAKVNLTDYFPDGGTLSGKLIYDMVYLGEWIVQIRDTDSHKYDKYETDLLRISFDPYANDTE